MNGRFPSCALCGAGHSVRIPCGEWQDPLIGELIGDKYAIVRLLGRGGMGNVYEARHIALGRRFAIKFILPELAADLNALSRFENEARSIGGLEHPNLVAVTDFGRAVDGSPYLVMEFLCGEDSAALLRRAGPLPVPRAVDLVVQACRGVEVAHKAGIVHRDIKPANFFVTRAGDGTDLLKVLDFGVAKLWAPDASAATKSGVTLGTANYMSPEQARGASNIDHRSDVWSLGVVLYEFLSGQKPFSGGSLLQVAHMIANSEPVPLAKLCPDLPPELIRVVAQSLKKRVAERTPTAAAFAKALLPFVGRASPALPGGWYSIDRVSWRDTTIAYESTLKAVATQAAPARRKPLLGVTLGVAALVALSLLGVQLSRSTHFFSARDANSTTPRQQSAPVPLSPQQVVVPLSSTPALPNGEDRRTRASVPPKILSPPGVKPGGPKSTHRSPVVPAIAPVLPSAGPPATSSNESNTRPPAPPLTVPGSPASSPGQLDRIRL